MQAVVEYTDTVAPVTREHLDKRVAELESTLIKWIVGTGGAMVLAVVGSALGAVNFLAAHYRPSASGASKAARPGAQ